LPAEPSLLRNPIEIYFHRKSTDRHSGTFWTGCGKSRCCTWFWVAQRFTAARTSLFRRPASAAEVSSRQRQRTRASAPHGWS